MLGNLGGTNEANFSKTPSYSLSISRGLVFHRLQLKYFEHLCRNEVMVTFGSSHGWAQNPSHGVQVAVQGDIAEMHGVLFKSGEMYRNVVPISDASYKLHFASFKASHFVANFAPSIFSFSSSHSRKHLCNTIPSFRHWNTCKTWISWPRSWHQKPHHFQGPETAERSTLPIRRRSESSEIPHSHKPHMRSQGRRQWYLYQLNTVALHLFSLFRIASWHSCSTPQSHYRFWLTLYSLDISN